MKYYDHYILAQGGIHNITAFAVAFNFIFFGFHLPACLVSTALVAFDTCRLLISPQNNFSGVISGAIFSLFFIALDLNSLRSSRAAHGGHCRWPCLDFTGIYTPFE